MCGNLCTVLCVVAVQERRVEAGGPRAVPLPCALLNLLAIIETHAIQREYVTTSFVLSPLNP